MVSLGIGLRNKREAEMGSALVGFFYPIKSYSGLIPSCTLSFLIFLSPECRTVNWRSLLDFPHLVLPFNQDATSCPGKEEAHHSMRWFLVWIGDEHQFQYCNAGQYDWN